MLKKLLKLFKAYAPAMLWAGLIFILSAQSALPGFDIVLYDFFFKKLSHIFVYGVLYFLLYRAANNDQPKVKNWIVPFLITLAYASLDELHQVFTPDRHPSPVDIGYDMLGASIAFLKIYNYI
jgi:VanZ family protein